jgi:hypothetical protein
MTCCARWVAVGCATLLASCDYVWHVERVAFVGPEWDATEACKVLCAEEHVDPERSTMDDQGFVVVFGRDEGHTWVWYDKKEANKWSQPDRVYFWFGWLNFWQRGAAFESLRLQDEVFARLRAKLPENALGGDLLLTRWYAPDDEDLMPGPLLEEKAGGE